MGSIKNSVATRRLPGYTSYKLMIDSDGNNQQLVYVPVNHISYLSTTQNVKNRIQLSGMQLFIPDCHRWLSSGPTHVQTLQQIILIGMKTAFYGSVCSLMDEQGISCLPFAVDQKSCVTQLKQRVVVWLTMKTIASMPRELVCCSCSAACGWPSWINNGDTKYKHADDTLPFCNNRILYNPSIGPSDIQSVSNMWVKNTLSKSGGLNK